MKEGQKVWLVKYALTEGIFEDTVAEDTRDKYVRLKERKWTFYTVGRDVFADRETAVQAAEGLRQKKLGSLRKQCMKLEKLSF